MRVCSFLALSSIHIGIFSATTIIGFTSDRERRPVMKSFDCSASKCSFCEIRFGQKFGNKTNEGNFIVIKTHFILLCLEFLCCRHFYFVNHAQIETSNLLSKYVVVQLFNLCTPVMKKCFAKHHAHAVKEGGGQSKQHFAQKSRVR